MIPQRSTLSNVEPASRQSPLIEGLELPLSLTMIHIFIGIMSMSYSYLEDLR
jgi:hypothetical protein